MLKKTCLLATLLLFTTAANAGFIGETIGAQLEPASRGTTVDTQFVSPVVLTNSGPEFTGFLKFQSVTNLAGITLDFEDETLRIRALPNPSGITGATLFTVRLSNLPSDLIGVRETLASGLPSQILFVPSISEIQFTFRYFNKRFLHEYAFEFRPLQISAPSWSFGLLLAMAMLGRFSRRSGGR